MGNIKNKEAFMTVRVDWEFLNDCFPRNIRPTDMDGFVEINGHGLIIEHKQKGQSISYGQELSFRNICKGNKMSVIVFWADLDENGNIKEVYQIRTYRGYNKEIEIKEHDFTSQEMIKHLVKKWVEVSERLS